MRGIENWIRGKFFFFHALHRKTNAIRLDAKYIGGGGGHKRVGTREKHDTPTRVRKLLWRKCAHFPNHFRGRHFPGTRISRPTCHFSCRAEDTSGLLLYEAVVVAGAIKEWNDVIP